VRSVPSPHQVRAGGGARGVMGGGAPFCSPGHHGMRRSHRCWP
jgi:hypothetical protein